MKDILLYANLENNENPENINYCLTAIAYNINYTNVGYIVTNTMTEPINLYTIKHQNNFNIEIKVIWCTYITH